MDNIEMFHHKKMAAAETDGFRFKADLFKSAPTIISVVVVDNIETFQKSEYGCCRNRWFQIRSRPVQISPDYHSFLLRRFPLNRLLQKPLVSHSKQTYLNHYRSSMALVVIDNIETFHHKKIVLQKPLVSYLKQTSSTQHRSSSALAVMDNIETFHNEKNVVAETVGFRLEADLFKSVQIVQGVGWHRQH